MEEEYGPGLSEELFPMWVKFQNAVHTIAANGITLSIKELSGLALMYHVRQESIDEAMKSFDIFKTCVQQSEKIKVLEHRVQAQREEIQRMRRV